MFSTQIEKMMRNVPNFLGVFSRDNLPKPEYYPFSLISNTDLQTEEGTHWLAIYVDESGNGYYFDSYAIRPFYKEFYLFLKTFCPKNFRWNRKELQCTTCVTCGEYCCCYVILRAAGYSHREFLDIFSDNSVTNDIIVQRLFEALSK